MPELQVVPSSPLPDPPYPPEIRARGWKFQIDFERIQQSDTWALATAEMRPWLLMLWTMSWHQNPCGSFPNNDELIAARIGMDFRQFKAHRDLLMRGWRLHLDGRYYHPVITDLVLDMFKWRSKDAARQFKYKQGLAQKVTRESRVTPSESRVSNGTHTHTHTHTQESQLQKHPASPKRKSSKVLQIPDGWAPSDLCAESLRSEFQLTDDQMRRYLEGFVDYCQAKAKTYANFDAAFRNCVRGDWFNVRSGGGNGQHRSVGKGTSLDAANRAAQACLGPIFGDLSKFEQT